jgi:hypothetical protein
MKTHTPEDIARIICTLKGKNPDEYYEEFNKDAAFVGLSEEDCFNKIYNWQDHLQEAYLVLSVMKELGVCDES